MRIYIFYSMLILLCTGCALSNFVINLPASGLKNPIEGGNGREVVVVIPFKDDRTKKDWCGGYSTRYGGDGSCDQDPGTWIAQLLADELRASDFKVLDPNAPHGKGVLKIEGSLKKLFVEPIAGLFSDTHEADLHVTLIATTENGLDAERTFYVKGKNKGIFAGTGKSVMYKTVRTASDQLLAEMVKAIFYLMNKYPQIGMTNDKSITVENRDTEV